MGEYKHIYEITSPEYLKDKSIDELNELAREIRKFIIDKVSHNGGHLSANLGVVELTIALHYVFDFTKDKLIFDVGHQSYVHKILTGRAKDFDDLRKMNGTSGFPKYSESSYDAFEVGHSSTSISAMCGFLEEKKTNNDIGEVVSVIGDGAFQNGLSLSGLNYLASKKDEKGIVIINDNEMSISKNVGWTAQYFNRLRIKKGFKLIRKLTTVSFRNAVKSMVYKNSNNFSLFGLTYIGPIDGHNIKELIQYFEYAKKSSSSLILHVKTIKGKGYLPAENDEIGKYHGVGPFDIESGEPIKKDNEISFSNAVGNTLNQFLEKYSRIKILTPGMLYGMGLNNVKEEYHNRIIDIGIAEENAVIMASAMARCGAIPIIATYSSFLQRAYDEINHDIARPNSHVIFLVDHAGIVSRDGDTHQGIFDISMLASLPNMIICAPKDISEFISLLDLAINTNAPFVIRYPKVNTDFDNKNIDIEFAKWNVVKELKQTNVLTYGPSVIEFNEKLPNDIGLINANFIKPIDCDLLNKLDNTTLYIYEDVINVASLASFVIEYCYKNKLNINIKTYGLDEYPCCGTLEELLNKYNLNIDNIINDIKNR